MPDFVHNLEYMLSVIPADEHDSLKKRVAWALGQGWTDIGLWTDFGKSPSELDLCGVPPRGRVSFVPTEESWQLTGFYGGEASKVGSKAMTE